MVQRPAKLLMLLSALFLLAAKHIIILDLSWSLDVTVCQMWIYLFLALWQWLSRKHGMQKISRECPAHTVEQSGSEGFAEEKNCNMRPLQHISMHRQPARYTTENENGMSMNI